MKKFRHYDPEQVHLLPENPRTWLPEDHLVFFLDDVVDQLDLGTITQPYEEEERGYPPYHPVMMVKVLFYAYCIGVYSSRKIMRRLHEDVAFRVVSGNNQPDFRTICEFRKRHLPALEGLFTQVLRLCMEANLVRLGHVNIDGTKVKANASRHKAMSYKRMGEKLDRLRGEVTEHEAQGLLTLGLLCTTPSADGLCSSRPNEDIKPTRSREGHAAFTSPSMNGGEEIIPGELRVDRSLCHFADKFVSDERSRA